MVLRLSSPRRFDMQSSCLVPSQSSHRVGQQTQPSPIKGGGDEGCLHIILLLFIIHDMKKKGMKKNATFQVDYYYFLNFIYIIIFMKLLHTQHLLFSS